MTDRPAGFSCADDEDPKDAADSADLRPATVDIPRIEKAIRELLHAVGENPDREGLLKTPNRVARAYGELMAWVQEQGLRLAPEMWESYVSDPMAVPDPDEWRTEIYWLLED